MTPENKLYKRFLKNMEFLKMKRMENAVSHGFGDVYCLLPQGRVTWIELKSVTRPQRYSSWLLPPSKIRLSQFGFHRQHAASGVQTWFLIEDNCDEPANKRMLYLVPGAVLLYGTGINYGIALKHFSFTSFQDIEKQIREQPYITKSDIQNLKYKFK